MLAVEQSHLPVRKLAQRFRGYLAVFRSRPSDLVRRLRDRLRVALCRFSGGRLFPWEGYLLDLREAALSKPVGMTTLEERAFLAWWARERYCGKGVIVELGPFIGASTVAFCHGLQGNKRLAKGAARVRVYDRFICDQFMADSINAELNSSSLAGAYEVPLEDGASSLPAFLRQTAEYQALIDLHPGDLLSYRHDGAAVEFLFVDAMKTPELAEHIVREFFGSLLPGQSLLIQQDFVHYWTSWIHLIQYDLRDFCDFAYHVPNSASAVFTVRKQIDCAAQYRLNIRTRSDAEIDEIFNYSLSLIGGDLRENVHAAKAMHYYHAGQIDRCTEVVDRYLAQNAAAAHDMKSVVALLGNRG